MKKIVKRVPRPLGLTALAKQAKKEPTETHKENLTRYAIQYWISNGGYIFGEAKSAGELAQVLRCTQQEVQKQMGENFLTSGIWDSKKSHEILEAIAGQMIAMAMEDRIDAEGQVSVLKKSQGDSYTPFITGELNKALSVKQSATGGIANIFRMLTGGGTTNIFNFNQDTPDDKQETFIKIDDAMAIIQEERAKQVATVPEVQLIEAKYDIASLPEVVATKQTGVDTSKEALNINMKEIKQTVDNYPSAMRSAEEAHHEVRREIMENIDLDAEDPEIFPE